jgi:hypothetical protein
MQIQQFGPKGAGLKRLAASAAVLGAFALSAHPAGAVPAFAVQTNQPCQACHVGGFGPQLTPFGRAFKLHGYVQRQGDFNVPLSAMVIASYVHSQKDQNPPPAPHYGPNDNATLDQFSLFFAGGFGQHLGAFIQTTYDGVAKAWHWDNLDVRAVTTTTVKGHDLLLGADLNNNPTVQDVWNTAPAWAFPYTTTTLVSGPGAAPLINGAFAQNTVGMTGYAWVDDKFFVEGGAYGSPGASSLVHLGVDPSAPGDISGLAPYGRIAYQQMVKDGVLEVGAFGLHADIHPGLDRSTGFTDRYTDVGVDASYVKTLASTDVVSANIRYTHEQESLKASCLLAQGSTGGCAGNSLDDIRFDSSYYWRNKVGGTVSVFNTTGSVNPVIYSGNRTFKPDSTGVMLQLDATPWGAGHSPLGQRFNMRVGLQYLFYTRLNGASSNWDGAQSNASDNNTFRVFTWLAY